MMIISNWILYGHLKWITHAAFVKHQSLSIAFFTLKVISNFTFHGFQMMIGTWSSTLLYWTLYCSTLWFCKKLIILKKLTKDFILGKRNIHFKTMGCTTFELLYNVSKFNSNMTLDQELPIYCATNCDTLVRIKKRRYVQRCYRLSGRKSTPPVL